MPFFTSVFDLFAGLTPRRRPVDRRQRRRSAEKQRPRSLSPLPLPSHSKSPTRFSSHRRWLPGQPNPQEHSPVSVRTKCGISGPSEVCFYPYTAHSCRILFLHIACVFTWEVSSMGAGYCMISLFHIHRPTSSISVHMLFNAAY